MTRSEITFEMLNAYVDGELDAAAAAEVARAVADQPMLARQVAALSRLRSAVAESVEAPDLTLPAQPPAHGRGTAIAASIAFALFVAGSALMTTVDRPVSWDWLAPALRLHHGWSVDGITAQARAALFVASYAKAIPGAYVPDLSAARLSVVHVSLEGTGRERTLLVGYRGTRDCKVSLMIFPTAAGLSEDLAHRAEGPRESYAWRSADTGYVIVSEGMDPDRFRLIAESVRQSSFEHLPVKAETRTALRRSRDTSAPCAA